MMFNKPQEKIDISQKLTQEELEKFNDFTRILKKRDKNLGLDISGNSVYGYVDNKKTYLMSYRDYNWYKNLCLKYTSNSKKASFNEESSAKIYRECDEFFRSKDLEI